MNSALVKLAKLANRLDQLGMFDYADQLDAVLAAGQRSRAVDDFINELNRIFVIVANDPRVESINKDNLQVILNVINTVAEKGTFLGPSIKDETFETMKDEANTTVEAMIELGK